VPEAIIIQHRQCDVARMSAAAAPEIARLQKIPKPAPPTISHPAFSGKPL
jgi:hypothetical protein